MILSILVVLVDSLADDSRGVESIVDACSFAVVVLAMGLVVKTVVTELI